MSPLRDTDQDAGTKSSREAEIATGDQGKPLGVCIFLTPADLDALDIDSEEAERLGYIVEDGKLTITESEER